MVVLDGTPYPRAPGYELAKIVERRVLKSLSNWQIPGFWRYLDLNIKPLYLKLLRFYGSLFLALRTLRSNAAPHHPVPASETCPLQVTSCQFTRPTGRVATAWLIGALISHLLSEKLGKKGGTTDRRRVHC